MERFVVEQYQGGRSLREIAELTDRSFSAVRNILAKHGSSDVRLALPS